MSVGKKTIMVIMVLVLILVGACDKKPAPNRLKDRSSEESSNQAGGSEQEKGTEGSATLSYTYKIEDHKNGRVNLVQVDIPLTFEPGGDDSNKYIVHGLAFATAYTQQMGSGAYDCFIQCDLPVQYIIKGIVIQAPIDEAGNCFISLEVLGKFDSVKPYGNCPEQMVSIYPCDLHKNDYDDGYTYLFSSDAPVYTPDTGDSRRTITAEISDVMIPPAIKDTCRWGD